MSYESEQRRLLALFEQADASENEQCSSDDEGEIDHISERSQGSDTEQECSDFIILRKLASMWLMSSVLPMMYLETQNAGQ